MSSLSLGSCLFLKQVLSRGLFSSGLWSCSSGLLDAFRLLLDSFSNIIVRQRYVGAIYRRDADMIEDVLLSRHGKAGLDLARLLCFRRAVLHPVVYEMRVVRNYFALD